MPGARPPIIALTACAMQGMAIRLSPARAALVMAHLSAVPPRLMQQGLLLIVGRCQAGSSWAHATG
jgi:hypothetical protein